MSTFTTLALPAYSAASWSGAGAIILQGPHHCAQKSTSTGSSDWRTALSKSASVAWITVSLIGNLLITAKLGRSPAGIKRVAQSPGADRQSEIGKAPVRERGGKNGL